MDRSDGGGQDPLSVAVEWVSRILAASLVMVGPAVLVEWLFDIPVLTLVSLLLGMILGMTYLIIITKQIDRKASRGSSIDKGRGENADHVDEPPTSDE